MFLLKAGFHPVDIEQMSECIDGLCKKINTVGTSVKVTKREGSHCEITFECSNEDALSDILK